MHFNVTCSSSELYYKIGLFLKTEKEEGKGLIKYSSVILRHCHPSQRCVFPSFSSLTPDFIINNVSFVSLQMTTPAFYPLLKFASERGDTGDTLDNSGWRRDISVKICARRESGNSVKSRANHSGERGNCIKISRAVENDKLYWWLAGQCQGVPWHWSLWPGLVTITSRILVIFAISDQEFTHLYTKSPECVAVIHFYDLYLESE